MSNLKNLVVAFCLISVLAITAYGQSGSCPPPGEMQGPPCSSAQLTTDDPTNPGQTNPGEVSTPPAPATDVITTVVDAAVGTLLSVL